MGHILFPLSIRETKSVTRSQPPTSEVPVTPGVLAEIYMSSASLSESLVNWLATVVPEALENLSDAGRVTSFCGHGFGLPFAGRFGRARRCIQGAEFRLLRDERLPWRCGA